jgi:hypothetical protein
MLQQWLEIKLDQLQFWYAKRLANAKHKSDGKRYWCLKTSTGYKVVNKHHIGETNRILAKGDRIDFMKLVKNYSYRTK